jgi:nucleoside-diphosphate-sugar epimerase
MKVVIAGASGFVGKYLLERLSKDPSIQVKPLARSLNPPCDLFSLHDVEKALEGQEQGIYLVHSMLPSSQLSQGNFADYDLILADNFARAAKKNGLKRIIYLGGIIPKELELYPEQLSLHLKSRLEVEDIFRSYDIPVLALRAGIVMGKEGSSFQMLIRLVERLPMMICPAWTRTKSSPIHIVDVVESFYTALKNPSASGTYDLEGGGSISYFEMLQRCAKKINKKRVFLDVPFFSPKLSKLWVRSITGAPPSLVNPLIESLKHNMAPDQEKIYKIPNWKYKTFDESIDEMIIDNKLNSGQSPKAYKNVSKLNREGLVQSVQRFRLPAGKSAEWASKEYVTWLNETHKGLIQVKTDGDKTRFYLFGTKTIMLELTLSPDSSFDDRILFYISGGILNNSTKKGRFEFRVTQDKKFLIAAIHDFRPKLPWYLYKYSQALMHARVMKQFGEYINKNEN